LPSKYALSSNRDDMSLKGSHVFRIVCCKQPIISTIFVDLSIQIHVGKWSLWGN
jgi:hypothetical protein